MKVLLCVALTLVVIGAQPYRRDKPGFCPPAEDVGVCANLCNSDESCPSNQKCCSHGCGRSCQVPTKLNCAAVLCQRPTCNNSVRPPGQCCGVCYGPRY
ncbi:WAP four-disulfide core domain protein 18-like [Dreissena polymorpha]|uniref:WAP domain-containing protein n=1 Tax=Dreissena polymorpha TaxID=45954 RepID=A0A9D4EJX6_DREPO|nr:WAP four-disulfide core domain protein 18-like [Dreissena polymorpha]KAH3780674.1 hypothetical protein DPMN_158493 [Dreissena polymorpha]